MKNVECPIIQDILPLYVDKITSVETNQLVETHLQSCDACKQEYEAMANTLYIPNETVIEGFQTVKKEMKRKKRSLFLITLIATLFITLGAVFAVFAYQIPLNYEDISLEIEKNNDEFRAIYSGPDITGVKISEPIEVNVEGVTKKVILVYYTKSVGFSMFNDDLDNINLSVAKADGIDAIYYGEYDRSNISSETAKNVIQNGDLIWEE